MAMVDADAAIAAIIGRLTTQVSWLGLRVGNCTKLARIACPGTWDCRLYVEMENILVPRYCRTWTYMELQPNCKTYCHILYTV